MIRATLAAERQPVEIDVEVGRTRELIGQADVALAVSGSVSLELLAARVPTVIVYRVSGLAYVVQSWYRRATFITLVNLLAAAEPIGRVQGVVRPGVPCNRACLCCEMIFLSGFYSYRQSMILIAISGNLAKKHFEPAWLSLMLCRPFS
jgi:hypothetical protein